MVLCTLAPGIRLISVHVTGEHGSTDAQRLASGIRAGLELGAQLICVPLGSQAADLHEVVREVSEGAVCLAADPRSERVSPACELGALPVALADGVDVARDERGVVADGHAFSGAGLPRRVPMGPSFAVARATAALARLAEEVGLAGPSLIEEFNKKLPLV